MKNSRRGANNTERKCKMKGYKGFNPGLVCKDKQYQENTVFEEPEAKICKKECTFAGIRLTYWIITI